ncbi:Aim24p NDAI_0E04640 [Naumovozyma dairenensis CBS 421]|uniref:Altered inheritance of mitochondria protein 24, mitochondrial n=1 Tax=Naumovozyma dairenensis (strain ATCC 10597 / BCRC 20456 / CBS 421 / NBRC 0211 / NRRL Y-12639) TaxID=1071378 RepID=G0WC11_NAUDC|nr:hypothetical protein NDAI_0E04640 [Naumovozyma dairenensis CBS 421]CCD25281.1 hypothetical protein NDAI_0E04640 [Naumovozyma dairenensis CBS 421]
MMMLKHNIKRNTVAIVQNATAFKKYYHENSNPQLIISTNTISPSSPNNDVDMDPFASTEIELLNQPPTIAKITIPNSSEFFIKKGSLISLYGTNPQNNLYKPSKLKAINEQEQGEGDNINDTNNTEKNIETTVEYNYDHHPFPLHSISVTNNNKNIIEKDPNFLNYIPLMKSSNHFQKISFNDSYSNMNSKINILVSSPNTNVNPFPSPLYHLKLDGTKDWNIFNQNAILAFENNSNLQITQVYDKNRKSSSFSSSPSLFNKYHRIKGRGNVLLSSSSLSQGIGGSILTVHLKNGVDEILINSKNLLAINGVSQLDMNNSMALFNSSESSHPPPNRKHLPLPSIITNDTFLINMKSILNFIKICTKNSIVSLIHYYKIWKIGKPLTLIKINGPRTILIQSNNHIPDSKYNNSNNNILSSSFPDLSFSSNPLKEKAKQGFQNKKKINMNMNADICIENDEIANHDDLKYFIATVTNENNVKFRPVDKV